jgi:hypothetical protein
MFTSGLSRNSAFGMPGGATSSADMSEMFARERRPVSLSAASGCTMRRVYTSVLGTLNWSDPSTKNGRRSG